MSQQQLTVADATRLAMQYHQSGNFPAATQMYESVLRVAPEFPDAVHYYGFLQHQLGNVELSDEYLKKSLRMRPDFAPFYSNYANALKERGELEKAAEYLQSALKLMPSYPEALNNLAVISELLGRNKDSKRFFLEALRLRPDYVDALNNFGHFSMRRGDERDAANLFQKAASLTGDEELKQIAEGYQLLAKMEFAESRACFEAALRMNVDRPEAHLGVSKCYYFQRMYPACESHARRVKELTRNATHSPIYAEALMVLASALTQRGAFLESIDLSEELIHLAPRMSAGYTNAALGYMRLGKLNKAIDYCKKAIELTPDDAISYNNLGLCYKEMGRLDEARIQFQKAFTLDPSATHFYQNYLFSMVFDGNLDSAEIAAAHREFDQRYAAELMPDVPDFHNIRRPEMQGRKLRIAFVSADFRNHAVYFFASAFLENYDREKFEVYVYYNFTLLDGFSEKAEKLVDKWTVCVHLSDEDLAKQILEDQIDIVIDPSGHTAGNRLLTLARKPAPLQVTWMGYPHSTGMKAIDYRITDNFAEPEGLTEHLNSEKLLRLPDIFCCFRPLREVWPEVIEYPPVENQGVFTFGCFNNFAKITPHVIALWSRILLSNPNSRLLLEAGGLDDPDFINRVHEDFSLHGIGPERLVLQARVSSNQYILYNKVDVALDPFPLNGGTTTADALWMGCPVITLAGDHFRSRMGVTLVSNAGLSELVAQDEDQYVAIATRLASDSDYLRSIRQDLRGRVTSSPVMDAVAFSRNFERAMTTIWQEWVNRNTNAGNQGAV